MNQPAATQEPFVPIDDVAQHFSVSVSTVRTWVKQNHIPRDTYIKLGNTYRFQLSAVARALTAQNEPEELETIPEAPEPDVTGEPVPSEELPEEEPETLDDIDLDDI